MSSDNVDAFMSITGSSKSKAIQLLTVFQDNLQIAVENYFEQSEQGILDEPLEEEEIQIIEQEENIKNYKPLNLDYSEQTGVFSSAYKIDLDWSEDEQSPKSEHSSENGLNEQLEKSNEDNQYYKLIKQTEITSTLPYTIENVELTNEKNETIPRSLFRKIIKIKSEVFALCFLENPLNEDDVLALFKINLTTKKYEPTKLPQFFSEDIMSESLFFTHLLSHDQQLFFFIGDIDSNSTMVFSIMMNQNVNKVYTCGDKPTGTPICALSSKNSAYLLIFEHDQFETSFSTNIALAEFSFEKFSWKLKDTIGLNPILKKYSSYELYDGKIYVFGGLSFDSEMDEELLSPELYQLSIYSKEPTWNIVKQTGDIPCHRYQHGSCISENSLFIFGGYGFESKYKINSLRDLYQFNLETLIWKKIEIGGEKLNEICFFHTLLHDDVFYLFGDVEDSSDSFQIEDSNIFKINLEKTNFRISNFKKLFDDQLYIDFKFEFETGESLNVHKIIISQNLKLKDLTKDKETMKVNYEHQCFKKVIQYLYTKELKIDSMNELIIILEICDDFEMYKIQRICFSKFNQFINENNVLFTLENSKKNENLKKLCLSFIKYQSKSEKLKQTIDNFEESNIQKFELSFKNEEEISLDHHLKNCLNESILVNLVITTHDEKQFKVHKEILCIFSDYFKGMFSGNYLEQHVKEIQLDEVESEVFHWIINFIYQDEHPLCEELILILDIIRISDLLLISSLKHAYIQHLKEKITYQNVVEILSWSDEYNILEIKEKCLEEMSHSEDHLSMLDLRTKNIMLQKQVIHLESQLDTVIKDQKEMLELLKKKMSQ
eukprot:gene2570-3532_t